MKKTHVFWLLHDLVFKLEKTVTNLFKIVFVQNFALWLQHFERKWCKKLCLTKRQSLNSTEFMLYWRDLIYSRGFKKSTSNNNIRKKKVTDIVDFKWCSQSWESQVSLCGFFLKLSDAYCTVELFSNTSLATSLAAIAKILRDYKEKHLPLLLLTEIPCLRWKGLWE